MPETTVSNSVLLRTEAQTILNGPGKLTFHPQGRNKFRCNQIARIKNVGKKQIFSLKSQLIAYARKTVPKNSSLPQSRIGSVGDVCCPRCADWFFGVLPGVLRCRNCGEKFTAIR